MAKKDWATVAYAGGSKANVYEIKRRADGAYGCSCPAWRFQKAPVGKRTCKHIASYLSYSQGQQ